MLKYNKEKLQQAVSNSYSLAQVLKSLSIVPAGGNYFTLKKYIKLWEIDISHFTGQLWNKGKIIGPKRNISVYLSNERPINSYNLKNRLIKENILEYRCSNCKSTIWIDKPIPLELHHIDGNSSNNSLDNLELLCPNCHAFTDNYRSKNIS